MVTADSGYCFAIVMKQRGGDEEEESPRLEFKSWYEYFFSVNNLCIGLSNFLIFPAKVFEYRGGAFVIAYLLMLFAIGYPVLYLELIIGQYHRCSPVVFLRRCVPILQGFGYLALISSVITIYPYQYSVARAFKFIVSFATSRSHNMPWSTCGNSWNTEDCYEFYNENCPNLKSGHIVFRRECVNGSALQGSYVESAEEQYLRYVVHKTGLTHMSFSNFDYGIAYSIFILWLSIAFVQNRTGTKTTPMIYVPTIFVFLICPFLFLRSLHLDGATNGIKEMFRVEWAELLYSKIWMDALSLVIQSLSLGIGGHSIMASLAPAKKYTFQGGPLYITMINDVQKVVTGIFITAQLVIILEFYGLDVLYEDIYLLIGRSSNRHWSELNSWAIWKWRWRMAPAFSFIYALSAFFRAYPSPETDHEYNHSYYDAEMEPEDSTGFWNKVYSPLHASTVAKEQTLLAPMDKPVRKPKMSINELNQKDGLSFDNYLKKLQEKNEVA
ncbi:unnamed protein product [Caenorhabditis brenneri]